MKIFYPGSFNPWHIGHSKVAEDVTTRFGVQPILEININASDCTGKGSVTGKDLARRLKCIPLIKIVTTPFPLFTDKSIYLRDLFDIPPEETIWFVCGTDTIDRMDMWMVNAKHEEQFIAQNMRFIVYPRLKTDKLNIQSEALNKSTIFIGNFEPLEISSTEIRNAATTQQVAVTADA